MKARAIFSTVIVLSVLVFAPSTRGQTLLPVRITIERAIQLALEHNHNLLATRTTILQSQAQEITANLRPNPGLFTDWQYLPLYSPEGGFLAYLRDSTQADLGLSYTIERGMKRQNRLQAAKDSTAVTRSQVEDTERGLTFQVASFFVTVQLAESTIDFAQQDLKSFQNTVDISQAQFAAGGMSENDNLKIKLQLLQFQTDLEQAELAKMQGLSDLRQLLGYDSVPADYDIAGSFDYQPLPLSLDGLQLKAIQTRPDLRAALQGITAANSQYALAKADGKQDVTVSGNYSRASGSNAASVALSVPLPIFDRNQGEIARTHFAITQAEEQQKALSGQVMTDVRDAYEGLQSNDRVVQLYRSGNLDTSQKIRDISEYAFQRGGTSLLDFLDAERSYRATQLAYRQAIAAYLLSLEQVRQAVGDRTLAKTP